jgi:CheY-like chemotaxis protein
MVASWSTCGWAFGHTERRIANPTGTGTKTHALAKTVCFLSGSNMGRVALVVDDDPAVLEVIAYMLAALGCEVICAHSGTDALAALGTDQRIEILITDINMAGIEGYELAEKAKGVRHGLNVILISGREADSHGFPILRKPFLQDDLRHVMKETTGLC